MLDLVPPVEDPVATSRCMFYRLIILEVKGCHLDIKPISVLFLIFISCMENIYSLYNSVCIARVMREVSISSDFIPDL